MTQLFTPACSQTGEWISKTLNAPIHYTVRHPASPLKDYDGNFLTIVYLVNPGFEKIGGNTTKEDVKWLLEQGYRVITLDYNGHSKATSPFINKDIIAINDAMAAGVFCGLKDCSILQSYVLFDSYRIDRNVAYFKDDPTVYNFPDQYTEGDSLRMDIIYPANPKIPVPTILSFSYSNSFATYDEEKGVLTAVNRNKRTFLPYTFAGFDDSILEGAPAVGMAWAIADHPKYCPWGKGKPSHGKNDTYKSYQTNPDAVQKVKSAIRTLRARGTALGLSEKIGIYGFSRGSTAGSLAIGDRSIPVFENAGLHREVSDKVQAAVLGPGVFDYTLIYNHADDGDDNLETRCPWAWGSLVENQEKWGAMGASYLVESQATAPTYFFYNTSDEAYYTDQIASFKKKLNSIGVPNHTLTNYGDGHAVPQKAQDLRLLYRFFGKYLKR
ncbi:hypothetical protein FKX85_10070 [Echinicola soli]|uniref:Uncharacterized protein n=1 Tax=Echinicola soli TaxID=2591634 RepID=A0A514CHS2_9BACT|nr:hypothetical protein [Echinicola soli]QDH79362.1 hypothetical protein FKX85_10070 [Echinicola soli]